MGSGICCSEHVPSCRGGHGVCLLWGWPQGETASGTCTYLMHEGTCQAPPCRRLCSHGFCGVLEYGCRGRYLGAASQPGWSCISFTIMACKHGRLSWCLGGLSLGTAVHWGGPAGVCHHGNPGNVQHAIAHWASSGLPWMANTGLLDPVCCCPQSWPPSFHQGGRRFWWGQEGHLSGRHRSGPTGDVDACSA